MWPMVLLMLAIQCALGWTVHAAGVFGDSAVAGELQRPLMLAWYFGIAALTVSLVQQDPLPGVDQDWLIRPLRRSELLFAKLAFLILTVSLPMACLDLAQALAMGFSLCESLPAMAMKELYVLAFFIVPVFALAATTRSFAELSLLAAILVVVYAGGTAVDAWVAGANRCPTCDTGLAWQDHLLQHLGVFAGALLILALQYRGRRTTVSRAVAVGGAVALACAHMPWSAAFAVEQWRLGHGPVPVVIEAAGESLASAALSGGVPHGTGRQATRALLDGDVDRAVDYLRRRGAQPVPIMVDLALHVGGLEPDDLLILDRTDMEFTAVDGRRIYRGVNADESTRALNPGVEPLVHHRLQVPAAVVAAAGPVRLDMTYSLSLLRRIATFQLAALDGALRSASMGVCGTRLEQDNVVLRCKQVGATAFCFSAVLVGADGARNPPVIRCQPDYRPYLPALPHALNFEGADLPVHDRYELAHYPVSGAALAGARVVVTVYAPRAHFQRRLSVPSMALREVD